ncbi:hypothetical protein ACFQH6_05210 [Halobacteriaceae archaeon GCM10025711]
MSRTRDELAGVVDLFGALTREELTQALSELAYKQGKEVQEEALVAEIEAAQEAFYLVEGRFGDEAVLVPGPAAFPTLPEYGPDLPHILDVEERSVNQASMGGFVADRLRREAAAAVEAGDEERAATLLDVTYDAEAWAPVELDDVRETLEAVL